MQAGDKLPASVFEHNHSEIAAIPSGVALDDHVRERFPAGRLGAGEGLTHTGCMSSVGPKHRYVAGDIQLGDWIKYRSEYYGSGRLAEVHALGSDVHSGDYAVTTEGNVLFNRILEVRRRPLNVLAFPASPPRHE